ERVLREGTIAPQRVKTVHITLPKRLPPPSEEAATGILKRWGLEPGKYLLYPANFWPHKNHELLLTAFGMYRAKHPASPLRLVLTGAPGPRQDFLRQAAARMNLSSHVVFAGFLTDEELAGVLWNCLGLVFPSLYEGFGMPVLEAMAAGKPVLVSKLTSLPEVTGDAAAFFDPRKPREIVALIERLEGDPRWASELARRGRERVQQLGDETAMAQRYWEIFGEALADVVRGQSALYGVHPDGWAGRRVMVGFDDGPPGRVLTLKIRAPGWVPGPGVVVEIPTTVDGPRSVAIARGDTAILQHTLPAVAGSWEIILDPVFQPKALGIGPDTRWLSARVVSADIRHPDGSTVPLEFIPHGA
ncbi:MAG: glycosyltransferase family 4 protein, partial [Armatimonadota bacterium]